MKDFIVQPQQKIEVYGEYDLVVVGGSCTGVFAAVSAARQGLKVALVEGQGLLGGTAVAGLVNIWHSLYNVGETEQIIAGLTEETIERLDRRNAVEKVPPVRDILEPSYSRFNPWNLTCILDEYIRENHITLMLHTTFVSTVSQDRKVESIVVNTVEGLKALKAAFFIDATGDGCLCGSLGLEKFVNGYIQPPTPCFYLYGDLDDREFLEIAKRHGEEFGLDDDWGWSSKIIGMDRITMRADRHISGVRCDRADDLTRAELEGRAALQAEMDMLQKYAEKKTALAAINSHIGIRETVHYKTAFAANGKDLLLGTQYDDVVMKGSYRIDVHHSEDKGITFKYLDGRQIVIRGAETKVEKTNWRVEAGLSPDGYATHYELPWRILVGDRFENFIAVGRMLNADGESFGALRVMVNLNQLGEAAGVGAYLAVHGNQPVGKVDGKKVRELLRKNGSAL